MRYRTTTSAVLALALALATAPTRAPAQVFQFVMQGALDARSSLVTRGTATSFGGLSPFTLTAFFDTRSPNLVAPIGTPGFVAYTPTSVELTLGGRTYAVDPFDAMRPAGLSVAVFDGTTPFGPPGHYAAGVIQNPLADGAGIVGDFLGGSPAFTLASGGVVPASFTEYFGVGVSSGVCLVGTPGNCRQSAQTAIPLTWAGQAYGLLLGSYEDDATDAPTAGAAAAGAPFSVTIQAVPEPGSLALMTAGLGAAAAAAARRRRGMPNTTRRTP